MFFSFTDFLSLSLDRSPECAFMQPNKTGKMFRGHHKFWSVLG